MDNTPKENKKPPLMLIVVGLISAYFLYQAYSRFSVNEYLSAGFFCLVSLVLLGSAYFNYKNTEE